MENTFFNDNLIIWNITGGLFFGFLVAFIAKRFQFLTDDGAITAFFVGAIIFAFGVWKWAIPIVVFFILSSMLSKVGKSKKNNSREYSEKGNIRDSFQVLANGGIIGCLAIFEFISGSELYYIFYVSFLAAVCADTWSTEIGTFFRGKTYDIFSRRKVEPGESGGISLYGTLGGILGSIIIGLSSIPWVKFNHLYYICFIAFVGLIGNLIDSFLGALVQAQYKCESCGIISERKNHCGHRSILISGNRFVTNSVVNFAAGTSSGVIGLIILDNL